MAVVFGRLMLNAELRSSNFELPNPEKPGKTA